MGEEGAGEGWAGEEADEGGEDGGVDGEELEGDVVVGGGGRRGGCGKGRRPFEDGAGAGAVSRWHCLCCVEGVMRVKERRRVEKGVYVAEHDAHWQITATTPSSDYSR